MFISHQKLFQLLLTVELTLQCYSKSILYNQLEMDDNIRGISILANNILKRTHWYQPNAKIKANLMAQYDDATCLCQRGDTCVVIL